VDPIRPITNPAEVIPPVIPTVRIDRANRRPRDPREGFEEREAEDDGEEEDPPDEEHPHIDVSA